MQRERTAPGRSSTRAGFSFRTGHFFDSDVTDRPDGARGNVQAWDRLGEVENRELRPHWRACKLILARVDAVTVSRALELVLTRTMMLPGGSVPHSAMIANVRFGPGGGSSPSVRRLVCLYRGVLPLRCCNLARRHGSLGAPCPNHHYGLTLLIFRRQSHLVAGELQYDRSGLSCGSKIQHTPIDGDLRSAQKDCGLGVLPFTKKFNWSAHVDVVCFETREPWANVSDIAKGW
jgi:hypothetical protein